MHSPWCGSVIYQIYPRSFADGNGDGVGDLRGITARLDHVAALGVDAVWICPFYPSPMKDFGYDVSDYCDVDPLFGTIDDFKEVLAQAHARGLKVMIDQVWSHSSDQHPWFRDSRSARKSAKSDWYIWSDARADGSPPNNWLSVFGGGAWTWCPLRRQYYLHHFLSSQPQLNLRNEQVVQALFAAARFWLDMGVDGFRLDAVDFMFHDPGLADNPPALSNPEAPPPIRPFGMQMHLHDMMHPDLMRFLERVGQLMAEYPGTGTLGELSSEADPFARVVHYTSRDCTRLDLAYSLALAKIDLTPAHLRDVFDRAGRAIEGLGVCWAFSNHDVMRAVTRWGNGTDDRRLARMLPALLTSLPGAACLYQGEELGLGEAEVARADMVDPYGIAFYPLFKGRDGARTPIPWSANGVGAGFTTAARSWLPVPAAHRALAVDRQRIDPESVLNATTHLLAWRKRHPALQHGATRLLDIAPPLLGIERVNGDDRVLALFNLGDQPFSVPRAELPACEPLPDSGYTVVTDSVAWRFGPYDALFARPAG